MRRRHDPSPVIICPWVGKSLPDKLFDQPGTLLGRLGSRDGAVIGAGMAVFVIALTGCALLRWQAPMIALASFGLATVLLCYARQIRVPASAVAIAGLVGLALGAGWAMVVGPVMAQAYSAALGAQTDLRHILLSGIAIPGSGALLMLAPAVVVRVTIRSIRDPRSGMAVGAWGATVFNAGSTATLLWPQLAMGVSAHDQSAESLLAEAIVEGLAWPSACLAVGAIFGIALWLTPAAPSGRNRATVVGALAAGLIVVTALGLVDVLPISVRPYIAAQLGISLLAVIAWRIVVARTVARRVSDVGTASYRGVLVPLIGVLGVLAAVSTGISALITPPAKAYVCPPDCGRPPLGTPVETNPRYSGDNGAFSVAYPEEGAAYQVTFEPHGLAGVKLAYLGGDTGTMMLFGEPADGRTSRQIVEQVLGSKYPDAVVSYEVPNASVGYQPGYGVVADVYSRDSAASFTRLRVIVMAAIKHDYALIAAAVGPYHEFSPDYGSGHPSGANLELAMDMGKYVNSFRWGGDRYGHRP